MLNPSRSLRRPYSRLYLLQQQLLLLLPLVLPRCQMAMVSGAGWLWCVSPEVVAAMDVAFANASGGRGLRAENPKPSHYGLVPGLPCQTAMVGGAG
jgi:hypothetical protein